MLDPSMIDTRHIFTIVKESDHDVTSVIVMYFENDVVSDNIG